MQKLLTKKPQNFESYVVACKLHAAWGFKKYFSKLKQIICRQGKLDSMYVHVQVEVQAMLKNMHILLVRCDDLKIFTDFNPIYYNMLDFL